MYICMSEEYTSVYLGPYVLTYDLGWDVHLYTWVMYICMPEPICIYPWIRPKYIYPLNWDDLVSQYRLYLWECGSRTRIKMWLWRHGCSSCICERNGIKDVIMTLHFFLSLSILEKSYIFLYLSFKFWEHTYIIIITLFFRIIFPWLFPEFFERQLLKNNVNSLERHEILE